MVSYRDAFIFVIGGGSMLDYREFEDGVEVYSIESDSWTLGPSLKQSRKNHSSCSLKHMIYTFCGCNFLDGYLASIERLNARDFLQGGAATWELIKPIGFEQLTKRTNPLVFAAAGPNDAS